MLFGASTHAGALPSLSAGILAHITAGAAAADPRARSLPIDTHSRLTAAHRAAGCAAEPLAARGGWGAGGGVSAAAA